MHVQFNLQPKIIDFSMQISGTLSVQLPPVLNSTMQIPTASASQNSDHFLLNLLRLLCYSLKSASRQKARENVMLACLIYFPHLRDYYPLLLILCYVCLISDILSVLCQCFIAGGKNEFQLLCLGQKCKTLSQFLIVKKKKAGIFCNSGTWAIFFHKYKNVNRVTIKKTVICTSSLCLERSLTK